MTNANQVKLYPRLSIDSARRVRQLAHTLNGQICAKCGKRTARHLPTIAGPWLAGTYDNDRAAAKAAQDALSLVFSSAEKVAGLKKTFQGAVVKYCRDAVVLETTKTLSDERTVSPDDAEGTYARVVATSLAVITSLLKDLPQDEVSKHHQVYEELIGEPKFWEFGNYSDAAVRRSFHRLIQTVSAKQPDLIEVGLVVASTAYVYKGLSSDQTGSSVDSVSTLEELTARFPSIWTDSYTGKKPAVSRLKQFLKHGSRSGPSEYWEITRRLFTKIPQAVLPKTYDDSKDLLLAARDGVARKDERFNASAAWPAYYTLVSVVSAATCDEDREKLLDFCVMPIIRQYLQPAPETTDWSITGAKAASFVAGAARVPNVAPLLERDWPQLADALVEAARTSQPQQSKDFDKSQLHVASAGERWAVLQKELFAIAEQQPNASSKVFVTTNINIVKECIQLLEAREGKPYGAAAIIEELLRTCASHLMIDSDFEAVIEQLMRSDGYRWVFWPSSRHLMRCLYAVCSQPFFNETFRDALDEVIEQPGSIEISYRALREHFPRNTPGEAVEVARQHSKLQTFVAEACIPGLNQLEGALFADLYSLDALAESTVDKIFSALITSLSVTDDMENLPATLDFFSTIDDRILRDIAASGSGEHLLPSLLRLEQHSDGGVNQKALAISSRLSLVSNAVGRNAKFSVVLQNLENVSLTSLAMDALYDLMNRLLGPERMILDFHEMLPTLDVWTSALQAVVRPPSPSLALLSPLGGAVHLVLPEGPDARPAVRVDGEGLSQALRIAMYVSRLTTETNLKERLQDFGESRWPVVALLYISVLLAEDNLSVLGTNLMWDSNNSRDVEPMVLEFITEANAALNELWQTVIPELHMDGEPPATGSSNYARLLSAIDDIRSGQSTNSAARYYVALASAKISANLFDIHGHYSDQAKRSEGMMKQGRSSRDSILLSSYIVGLQYPLAGTQTLTRFCNELVADLTALDMSDEQHEHKTLEQLVLLNTILQTQEDAVATIAKQRLIFLVKRLVPALNTGVTLAITAELCKALALLLPGIEDIYGEHWAQVMAYLISFWTSVESRAGGPAVSEGRIVLTHASMKLYATLRKLAKAAEPNDDLADALKESDDQTYNSLVLLLKSASGVSDETHQPLMVTHKLLARQISRLPQRPLHEPDELYPLIYTPSRPVQQAAFDLLHQHIPASQEQVSFDAALENKTAQLPEELLSLILEAPTLDSLVDASFDRTMPVQLQGYLYSWRLLFDHFGGSSYRVKSDYIEGLKEGTYLPGLLGFSFDFLGHSHGKPVDASKFNIQEYTPDIEPSPERDVQWLLTHLYYLALTHLPSLVKSYYLDIRSRQTSLAVESWTAKYISPLIINASLQAVAEWSEKSVKEDPEYEKMAVKVGLRSKEINVSYVVDEQTMAIKVVLPEAYPLASAQVVGVSRVAVKEEKWQSWLRNCQGVITFSVSLSFAMFSLKAQLLTFIVQNGSIIDGLSAWRKNVTGALKGAAECSICYSLVSADRQLPTKKCQTCRNTFHASCLYKWFKTSNASTCKHQALWKVVQVFANHC